MICVPSPSVSASLDRARIRRESRILLATFVSQTKYRANYTRGIHNSESIVKYIANIVVNAVRNTLCLLYAYITVPLCITLNG